MNAAVERLFAKEIDAKWNDGIAKGKEEVAVEMLKSKMDDAQIVKFTQLTFERIKELKKTLMNSAAVL